VNGGEECLLSKVEEVPAKWKLVKIQYGVIDLPKIVV